MLSRVYFIFSDAVAYTRVFPFAFKVCFTSNPSESLSTGKGCRTCRFYSYFLFSAFASKLKIHHISIPGVLLIYRNRVEGSKIDYLVYSHLYNYLHFSIFFLLLLLLSFFSSTGVNLLYLCLHCKGVVET